MMKMEKASILEFIDIRYSEKTWKNLQQTVIRAQALNNL